MRVLLVAVHFHSSFGWSIEQALLRAGHDVRVFDYRANPVRSVPALGSRYWARRMPRKLLADTRSFRPELVFLAKGELVPGEILEALRRELRCRIVNWFPDGRLFGYTTVLGQLRHLDRLFGKNRNDLERLRLLGYRNGRFLLHAADVELHLRQVTDEEALRPYRRQVAFVGSYYPYRDLILSQLLDFDLAVWGSGWRGSRVARKPGVFAGREARSFEQAKVFRGATVSLNTHHFDDLDGLNQRVFDICGSGGCQLLDGRPSLEGAYRRPEELDLFESVEELREKVAALVGQPARAAEMGRRAQARTASAHTYDHRIAEILQALGQ